MCQHSGRTWYVSLRTGSIVAHRCSARSQYGCRLAGTVGALDFKPAYVARMRAFHRLLWTWAATLVLVACSPPTNGGTGDGLDASLIDGRAVDAPSDGSTDALSDGVQDAPSAPTPGLWARGVATPGNDFFHHVAARPDRSVVVAGNIGGTFDFGGGAIAGPARVLVARDASGNHMWARALAVDFLDTDAAGNVYVSGPFNTSLVIDGQTLTASGSAQFLARLDGATGQRVWAAVISTRPLDQFGDISVSSDGQTIAVVGNVAGNAPVNLGGGDLVPAPGLSDIVLAVYDGVAQHRWSKVLVGPKSSQIPHGISLTPTVDIVIAGEYETTDFDAGGGPLPIYGQRDVFIARYAGTNGAHMWSRGFGSPTNIDQINALTTDSDSVYIGGNFDADADFGGAHLFPVGGSDALLARYDLATGAHVWSRGFGGPLADSVMGIAVVGTNLVYDAIFNGTAVIGPTTLTSAGSLDLALGTADLATGALGPATRTGGTSSDRASAFAASPPDFWIAGDTISTDFVLFGEPLTPAAGFNAFIGRTQL
jgi:hypothetical protein